MTLLAFSAFSFLRPALTQPLSRLLPIQNMCKTSFSTLNRPFVNCQLNRRINFKTGMKLRPLQIRREFAYYGKESPDDKLMHLRTTPEVAQATTDATIEISQAKPKIFRSLWRIFRVWFYTASMGFATILIVSYNSPIEDYISALRVCAFGTPVFWTRSNLEILPELSSRLQDKLTRVTQLLDSNPTMFETLVFSSISKMFAAFPTARHPNTSSEELSAELAAKIMAERVLFILNSYTLKILILSSLFMAAKRIGPTPIKKFFVRIGYFRADLFALNNGRFSKYVPRISLLTSAFSHRTTRHFEISLLFFTLFAGMVEVTSNSWNVCYLTLQGIIFANVFSLSINILLRRPLAAMCGLTGATCSMIGFLAAYSGVQESLKYAYRFATGSLASVSELYVFSLLFFFFLQKNQLF
ncbi:uncharacterized protein V2V93DRAFT_73935 [Kockiozyma suomiensis]|uniref:uncharacterized protein n=1 Tax=Kockiozyma suomiensis TaxID=1337062 RepID=UPI0033431F80